MKLSKASWLTLIIGVIVIAALFLGWIYIQQINQKKQLDVSLTQAQQKLDKINPDALNTKKDQLTQQIAQINTQISDTKTKLSSSQDSIDATNTILADAKNCNVNITDVSSSGLSSGNLSGVNCETLSMSINITGNVNDIASFASSLKDKFPTSEVKVVQMTRTPPPSPTPTPTPTPGLTPTPTPTALPPPGFPPIASPDKDFSANINLVIYNYEGE